MDLDSIRNFCLSFPQARENLQWGAELCFKVRGKIFTMVGLEAVPQNLCLKCTPENFAELMEHEGIVPAPYVGRYKWALLESLDVLPPAEIEDLIAQSYAMVAAKAGKAGSAQRQRKRQRNPVNRRGGTDDWRGKLTLLESLR